MTAARHGVCPSTVVLIGGAEDKVGRAGVLRHLLWRTRQRRPLVAVCASASQDPQERVATYRAVFDRLGADVVDVTAAHRADAADPALSRVVTAADVVFFTGGSQERLVAAVAGTPLAWAVARAGAAGTILAGTSAGAAAASAVMIAGGDGDRVRLGSGLGWLPGLVVDQHFTQRARLPRLRRALRDAAPGLTGVGVDEDTAAVVTAGTVSAVGTGQVVLALPGRGPLALVDGDRHRVPATAGCTLLAG